jgi:hypothetical protein
MNAHTYKITIPGEIHIESSSGNNLMDHSLPQDVYQKIQDTLTEGYSQIKDLALYLTSFAGTIHGKVESIKTPTLIFNKNGFDTDFISKWTVICNSELSPDEEQRLISFMLGQMSDGFGEGFSEKEIDYIEGNVLVESPDYDAFSDDSRIYIELWAANGRVWTVDERVNIFKVSKEK